MSRIELIATAAFGLEALVADEVRALGYTEVKVDNGKVTFVTDEYGLCRANLWLRSADRVLVKMGEFTATTFDELFDQTKALPWPEWLPKDAEFPVSGKSVKSQLSSVPACQAVVKKAIVAKMEETYGLSWFKESGELFAIEVAILKDVVTLTIDTSGPGLHKRGYRELTAQAPLKETLAAGLVRLSFWKPDRQLIDPMCGSGTIPIEAALIGANIAPGLRRQFSAEKWPNLPAELWKRAREEAEDLIKRDADFRILGYDKDASVLKLARHHAARAGVEHLVDFHPLDISELKSGKKFGYIVTNPPYGERLGERSEVRALYKEMGRVFKKLGEGTWSSNVITSMEDFEKIFGSRASKKRKLYNGRIKVDYYQFFGPRPPRRDERKDFNPENAEQGTETSLILEGTDTLNMSEKQNSLAHQAGAEERVSTVSHTETPVEV